MCDELFANPCPVQVNCAHLENHLHEARETAQTHLVTSERRGKEYDSLRAKSVRMHGLMDRLSRCLAVPNDAFPEALSNLATSLSNGSLGGDEEQFVITVRQLAEQVRSVLQLSRPEGRLKAPGLCVAFCDERRRPWRGNREVGNLRQLIEQGPLLLDQP